MNNTRFIKSFEINNFKSIEHLKLKNRQYNIFIGEPNVGKSNILEALGMISALGHRQIIRKFIRMKNFQDLIYKKSLDRVINLRLEINGENYGISLEFDEESHYKIQVNNELKGEMSDHYNQDISEKGLHQRYKYGVSSFSAESKTRSGEFYNFLGTDKIFRKIKYYKFRDFNPKDYKHDRPLHEIHDMDQEEREQRRKEYQKNIKLIKTLEPPIGENIYHVLKNTEDSRKAFRDLIEDFNLKLLINQNDMELQIIKEEEEGIFFTLPLYSLADTLQSVLFYQTAILSNKGSIIVLEEPESHTFPYYTYQIGEMITEDKNNQYFIATHNPYFLDAIYSKVNIDELQINIVQSENNQTKVKQLNNDQVPILFEDDVFMSLSHFDEWPITE